MHFLMAQDLVNEREAELRRGTRRLPRNGGRACLGSTRRQRLGWTLVEVGLRLAVEPDDRTENVGARDFRV
ncbi:hypothetical protein ACFWY9_25725 [Amycolatopsis sp. NPDC059027]|uniref:hypothetical protein n=1 Tax=unclassified Amycolatopsis TaxID=2618356 RepID=UPI00367274A1